MKCRIRDNSHKEDNDMIESWLSDELKISAHIDLGLGGTSMFSKGNTYVDMKSGLGLSHNDVLIRIMAA